MTLNASAYHRTVAAFSVINKYPSPVLYTAPRQELTSGNAKLDLSLRLAGWQTQVSNAYLAPDLLPQGRTGSRYGLDLGMKKSVNKGKGEIVINATDLLNTMELRRTIRGTDFRFTSTDFLETQVIRVGYSWKS